MALHKLSELEKILSDAGIEVERDISRVSTPHESYMSVIYTLEDQTKIEAMGLTHDPSHPGEEEKATYDSITVSGKTFGARGMMEDVAAKIARDANVGISKQTNYSEVHREESYFEVRLDNPKEVLAAVANVRTQYVRLQRAERNYQGLLSNLTN